MLWIVIIRVLAVAGAIAIGYFVYRKATSELRKARSEHRLLKKSVDAVRKVGGRITPAELSFELDIPIDWAEQLLQRLVEEDVLTTGVDGGGRLVYEEIPSDWQEPRGVSGETRKARRIAE